MPMPRFKERLARGEFVFGTWITFSDPAAIEVLGRTGFDFLLIDGEHAPFDESMLRDALIAADNTPSEVVVRVRANEEARIKLALDLGAHGVLVPMVHAPDDARRAVAAAKYPPLGGRGLGPWRAADYYRSYDDYIARANDETALIIQIEHADAVAAIDDILAVPGFDAVFIGPADLTASLGRGTDTGHADTAAAIERVAAACRAKGMPLAIDAGGPGVVTRMGALGFRLFTIGMDATYLDEGAKATVAAARAAASP